MQRKTLAAGRRALAAAAMALLSGLPPAQANELSFGKAFEAALGYDAGLRAATHERDAAMQSLPIARAGQLPVVQFSASTADVEGRRSFINQQAQEVRTRLAYQSPSSSLSVRMPLVNFETRAAISQAEAQTRLAEQQYRIQGLELVERLATAYLQLLLAQQLEQLLQQQLAQQQVQATQSEQRLARGEGTRVQLAQAQSQVELAQARLVDASLQRALAQQAVARVTGVAQAVAVRLPDELGPSPLPANDLNTWVARAIQSSPSIQARQHSVEVAQAAVRRQFAGHLPRLDAVGSVSRQESDSTANIGQTTTLRSMGLQLVVPIFNGGGVDASVKQAMARQRQAEEELREEREALALDIQRHWQTMGSTDARLMALSRTLQSSRLAVQGAERALAAGVGTQADLADARATELQVRREMLQARLEQLVARVRLQLRAGQPMADVVADLGRLLATPMAEAEAPAAAASASAATAPGNAPGHQATPAADVAKVGPAEAKHPEQSTESSGKAVEAANS